MNDPVVAVAHPVVHDSNDEYVTVHELLYVTCSECGDLTDYDDADEDSKHRLQRFAVAHAASEHDGLVEAVGWSR